MSNNQEKIAIEFLNQGKLENAEFIYKNILEKGEATHVTFLNLSVICGYKRKYKEMISFLQEALKIKPDYPEAQNNLGFALRSLGRLDESIICFKKAISLKTDYVDAINNLGIAILKKGDFDLAELTFKKAISINPKTINPKINLAYLYKEKGKAETAMIYFKEILNLKPDMKEVLNELGALYLNQNKYDLAIRYSQKVITLEPKNIVALYNIALSYKKKNNFEMANNFFDQLLKIESLNSKMSCEVLCHIGDILLESGDKYLAINKYKNALNINPKSMQALNNLGSTYKNNGQLDKAYEFYSLALKVNPDSIAVKNNLALLYSKKGDFFKAIDIFKKLIDLNPSSILYNNLANAYKGIGDCHHSILSYLKALQISPEFPEAHKNLAFVYLLSGNYSQGWEEYTWRTKTKYSRSHPHGIPNTSEAKKIKFKKGEKLLLVSEQGLGDTIQFIRYAIYLRNLGLDLKICIQDKLHTLIKVSGIDDNPISPKDISSVIDREWISLLSLPKFLKVSPQNPIISNKYISPSFELFEKWKRLSLTINKPIIGLNWQGDPVTEELGYRGRSVSLEIFKKLADLNICTFLSLQKGCGSEQLLDCSFRDSFVNYQDRVDKVWDFAETSAIVASCDLVISCDTAIAHLAGAMGKNVWLLLKYVPDWRWGLKGKETFWYESMRLYRQSNTQNWAEVIEIMIHDFYDYIDTNSF